MADSRWELNLECKNCGDKTYTQSFLFTRYYNMPVTYLATLVSLWRLTHSLGEALKLGLWNFNAPVRKPRRILEAGFFSALTFPNLRDVSGSYYVSVDTGPGR